MSTRYLEINSSYRNRDEYPNPSEFNVIVGNYTESFPQITSFPQYTFNNNNYGTLSREPFTNGNIARPSLQSTSAPVTQGPIIVYPTYAGYMMFAWDTIFPTPAPTDSRVVVKYNDINNTFTLSSPLSLTVSTGLGLIQGDGQVLDPSPCKTIGDPNNSATWNTPYTYYNIQSFSRTYSQFPVLTQSTYVGSYLMYEGTGSSTNLLSPTGNLVSALGVPEGRIITSIDTTTLQITIDSPFSYTVGTPANMLDTRQFSIRKTLPILVGSCSLIPYTNNILDLGTYASSEDNIYKDAFLYIRPSFNDSIYPNLLIGKNTFSNYIYKILKYDGATKQAYLDRSIDPAIGISSFPSTRVYEIMRNTEASWSPLLYTGSSIVRPDPICMRVGLTALILPNVLLTNGNRIAFYPFVYVELRNTSSKTVGTDIIYSNNPNSHRAIFVVPITDIRNPRRSPFIKLKSKMKQTIKFKPNDSFIFRVYLPDGSPFQPIQTDNPLPLPPIPLRQLEAVFNYTPV